MCLGKSVKEKFDTFSGSPSIATVAGASIDIFKKYYKYIKIWQVRGVYREDSTPWLIFSAKSLWKSL